MRNALALSFVVLFLGACAHYTYTHTHPRMTLIERDRYADEQWREYNRAGGAFRGLE